MHLSRSAGKGKNPMTNAGGWRKKVVLKNVWLLFLSFWTLQGWEKRVI
jgi:hypothetical protein